MPRLLIAFATLGALGCASPSIVRVTVESDLAVPADLDEVVMEIEGRSASARLTEGASLPATLELRASGDRLGPFDLVVVGRRAGAEVARVTRSIAFTQGSTIAITVRLDGACVGVACDPGERCEAGACVPDGTDGGVPEDGGEESDAGLLDGGGVDACSAEACNARDDDCDGQIDEVGCDPCVRSLFFGHVYLYCDLPRPADAARAHCAGLGYDLVTVEEAVENDHVDTQRGTTGADPYLGLRRVSGDTFGWVDGSASAYRRWHAMQPGAGDCVVMRNTGAWQTADCGTDHPFFCELAP